MTFGTKTQAEFEKALETYYVGVQKIADDYAAKHFPNNPKEPWELHRLKVRARIKHGGGVHSFVDYATGDVLKASSWVAPAKHARGNIYDAHNGLKTMGPYGPAYLK